jgi:hypothetical protein
MGIVVARFISRFAMALAVASFAAILAFPAIASATTGPSDSCAKAVSRSNISLGYAGTTSTTYDISSGTYVLNATFNQDAGLDDPYLTVTFTEDDSTDQVTVTVANMDPAADPDGSDTVAGDYVLQWFCS